MPPLRHYRAGHHEQGQREQRKAGGRLIAEGDKEGYVRTGRDAEHQCAETEGECNRHLRQKQDNDQGQRADEDEHGYPFPVVRRCDLKSRNWLSAWSTM